YADPPNQIWFLKDETAGVSITRDPAFPALPAGTEVELQGEAQPDAFAPTLVERTVRVISHPGLPPAPLHSRDELLGGALDSQWIGLRGVVRSVTCEKGRLRLDFSTPTGLQAFVAGCTNGVPPRASVLVDSVLRLRGVCGTRFNARGNVVDSVLFVPDLDSIEVEEPASSPPFDLPLTRIATPLRYDDAHRFGHRIRVSGVVTAVTRRTEFFMQDASGGAFVQSLEPLDLTPGDMVEAAVFPEPAGATPSMMAGVIRKLGRREDPVPKVINASGPWFTQWDSTLVTAQGEVQEVVFARGRLDVVLRAGEQRFSLQVMDPEARRRALRLRRGAVVAATGVCTVDLDDQKEPRDLGLLVVRPSAIQVLRPGPWWTPERALGLLGGLTLLLAILRAWGLWREARLREQYRLIFHHATDPISTHDVEGRFTSVNPAWERVTGLGLHALVDRRLVDLLPPTHRVDWQSWWGQVLSGSAAPPREIEITRADGRRIWLEVVSLMVRDPRGRVRVQSIGRDITRRHRDEQLRAGQQRALESIATGVPLPRVLEELVHWIEAEFPGVAASVLLVEPEGPTLRHAAAPNLPPRYVEALNGLKVPPGGGSLAGALVRGAGLVLSDPVGTPPWEGCGGPAVPSWVRTCWSAPIGTDANRVMGAFVLYLRESREPLPEERELVRVACSLAGIAIDRKGEELVRQQLEARLRQSEKMQAIGTLAGGIAHDFNNILATIQGNTEVLRMDLLPSSELQESLSAILTATERARGLVLQILAFSRSEQPERRLMLLGPVITEALNLIRASLPASVEIRTSLSPSGLQVRANATQIHQVLMNLCYNASQAMRGGAGRIEITEEVVEIASDGASPVPQLAPGSYLCIRVRDDGHGMDARTLERIFEPFFTTKGPGEGTGLGLAVVHGIMQSHDGAITVASCPGRGSTFHLYFPAVEAEIPSVTSGEDALPRGHGERILIVDDEAGIARFAARLLTRLGYHPTAVVDPVEALDRFLAAPGEFDALVTDLTMPRLTGVDLARRILAERPGLPVIFCTGNRGGGLHEGELSFLEGRQVLVKPFRAEGLA
ncbi:MAG TPA: hypothetical protein DCM86_11905, partial [Verrucomicrobiales bacterium]|nr:hypothetical protein [Verrucomicrobiales bacterium]